MGQVSPPIKCRHHQVCGHDQRSMHSCAMVTCPHRREHVEHRTLWVRCDDMVARIGTRVLDAADAVLGAR